jgi:hypothetical protein
MPEHRLATRQATRAIAIVVAGAALICFGSAAVASSTSARAAPSGGPPVRDPSGEDVEYRGTFTDSRWEGVIVLALWRDATHVSTVRGIAPALCDDRDFGRMVPGREGASGAVLDLALDNAGSIGRRGAFVLAGRQVGSRGAPQGPVSVTGTFFGDVVRGRVKARVTSSYDTCTATVAFVARRVRTPRAIAASPFASLAPGRLPPPGRWIFSGAVERGDGYDGVTLIVEDGRLVYAKADIPAPCLRRSGGTEIAYAGFQTEDSVALATDGSFSLSVRDGATVASLRGTFYGSNARGWVSVRNGKGPVFSSCKGQSRFWARRIAP